MREDVEDLEIGPETEPSCYMIEGEEVTKEQFEQFFRDHEEKIAVRRRHCLRCQHRWLSQGEIPPRHCPHCKTELWQVAPLVGEKISARSHECLRCSHKWLSKTEILPRICPHCKTHLWQTGKIPRQKLPSVLPTEPENFPIQGKKQPENLPWNLPVGKFLCARCDHSWESRADRVPQMCPHCKSKLWSTPK